jgi:16S rRNA (uracil1498-N3)-methyltransferase
MSATPFVHVAADLTAAGRGDTVALGDEDVHHLTRVLRLRPGAEVEVADGRGRQVTAILDTGVVVLTAAPLATPRPRPELVLAQALPKGRKLDEVVRLATELGVDRIVTAAAARSVVTLTGERAERAAERWRAVGRAAAEQARRPFLPHLGTPVDLAALPRVAGVADGGVLLVAAPGATPLPDLVVPTWRDRPRVTVVIGPEGGLTADEVATLVAAGAQAVGLGPTVLRTEHAGGAALAVLGALLGRWR